jgi:prepilin-type N-terminal cleavage/methylation domain-containing protein
MELLQSQKGFTLIEVLVSLFILGTAITGITYVITTNSSDAQLIKNSYIASGLVQEGVEVVRNLRDSDVLQGNSFGASLSDGTYSVQWDSRVLGAQADSYLGFDSGTHMYSYSSGAPTIFKRSVVISTESSIEKKILVTVTWSERNLPKSVIAEDHLFDY